VRQNNLTRDSGCLPCRDILIMLGLQVQLSQPVGTADHVQQVSDLLIWSSDVFKSSSLILVTVYLYAYIYALQSVFDEWIFIPYHLTTFRVYFFTVHVTMHDAVDCKLLFAR